MDVYPREITKPKIITANPPRDDSQIGLIRTEYTVS